MGGGGSNKKNHPVYLVLRTKRKNSDTHRGHRLRRAFDYGQEPNIRCFVPKAGLSRVTRAMRGGSQKVTNDDEGEGGVTIPHKIDDVIYEQPLISAGVLFFYIKLNLNPTPIIAVVNFCRT